MAGQKSTDQWVEQFKKADTDGSGCLDVAEVKALLKKGNSNLKDEQIQSFFEQFEGPDGNKKITKDEFISGLQKIEEFIKELRDLFDKHDVDKSGSLDRKELKAVLDSFGEVFPENEVSAILQEVDPSGDGKVSFDEFVAAFT